MSWRGDDLWFDRALFHARCGRNHRGNRLTGSCVIREDEFCRFVRQETDMSSGSDGRRLDQALFQLERGRNH